MSWNRVNQLNHGIKCKTVVEFRFLPSLNVKSPKYNIFHFFTTKYVHIRQISDNRVHTRICYDCLHARRFRLDIQKVSIL